MGPQCRSQYTIILIKGTPQKGAPNFGKPQICAKNRTIHTSRQQRTCSSPVEGSATKNLLRVAPAACQHVPTQRAQSQIGQHVCDWSFHYSSCAVGQRRSIHLGSRTITAWRRKLCHSPPSLAGISLWPAPPESSHEHSQPSNGLQTYTGFFRTLHYSLLHTPNAMSFSMFVSF